VVGGRRDALADRCSRSPISFQDDQVDESDRHRKGWGKRSAVANLNYLRHAIVLGAWLASLRAFALFYAQSTSASNRKRLPNMRLKLPALF